MQRSSRKAASAKLLRNTIRQLPLLAALPLLLGCAAQTNIQITEPPPPDYREIVARHIRENFFDPYSIRDARIAAPKAGQLSRSDAIAVEQGWVVCVRANAKNRVGGYTGLKTSAYLIRGKSVITSHSGDQHYEVRTSCADVTYEDFKEIDATPRRP